MGWRVELRKTLWSWELGEALWSWGQLWRLGSGLCGSLKAAQGVKLQQQLVHQGELRSEDAEDLGTSGTSGEVDKLGSGEAQSSEAEFWTFWCSILRREAGFWNAAVTYDWAEFFLMKY